MADPKEFVVKTREQIRGDYTRTVKNGLINLGIANPNVSEGSLDYIRGDALGAFGEEIYNLVSIKANAQLPDSALDDDLIRLAKIVGLDLRPAGPSQGFLVLQTSVTVPVAIPGGAQLLDPAGLSYEVLVGGAYASGELVPIRAVDTGARTNLPEGTTLRWSSAPPFVSAVALVASGGLLGGVDQETIEGLRARLLDYYRNPPGGGNWSQVNLTAENSSTFVQKGFTYPAVYGPSTMHVVVVGAPTATNKSRTVPSDVVETAVKPAVIGAHPEYADIVVTSADSYVVSVAFTLSLPSSRKASPPGPGGGWLDGTPWPTKSGGPAPVTATNSSVDFFVAADAAPIVGQQICYVSPANFKFYRAKITQVFGGGSPYRVVVDTGFFLNDATNTSIQVGDWVFPDAERMDVYVAAVLSAFSSMGPAEKTTIPGLLPRAYRKPQKEFSWPSQVDSYFLRALYESGEEVFDAGFLTSPATVPVNPGYQLAPFIAVPGQLAFYPQ
ncbi:baseplate J/gp47 family protein [Polyangium sp. 15x6]|uniref:baseplate J/gp47 family protein n=1 Tax=Polyangium sp. 15x6 TaxID=3042687 RepID=UPI00249A3F71|nr:baseplate J/gp47 family protein [Polyangium sp. 15x6]MDI3282107.1 baseplate J/gp47 family protein [Polyangium sp. 15x6]